MSKIIAIALTSIVSFFNSISFIPHISTPSPSLPPTSIIQTQKEIQPSERAIKVAVWLFIHATPSQIDELIKKDPVIMRVFSQSQQKFTEVPAIYMQDGTLATPKTATEKIVAVALVLDTNTTNLAVLETNMEMEKAKENTPVINYQQPIYVTQPVIQQQTYPKNCSTKTIGDYTYTNCY